jgi:hypothetical protein
VYDVTQDKNGFIWFGTENGLCRFDGKNFKTFTTKDGLPDNSILKVHADNTGRIYFNAFTHTPYYYQNDSFFKVPIPDKYKVDLSTIETFLNKGDKVILSGIYSSYMLDTTNHLILLSDLFNKKIDYIKKVYDTLIIAAASDSLFYIPDSGKIRSYPFTYADKASIIFGDKGQWQSINIEKKYFSSLSGYLGKDMIFLYFNNFLNFFSTSSGHLMYKIRCDKLSKAIRDNENNLWITTLGNGVFRFPSFNFRNINFEENNEVFCIAKTTHHLVAGANFSTIYNIPIYDKKHHYVAKDFSMYLDSSENLTSRLTRRNRIYVMHNEGNDLYIGTDAFLLKQTGSATPVLRKIFPVKDIDTKDEKLLVCTGRNVLLLNKSVFSIQDTLLRQRATCGIIYQGDYYIGSLGGLIKINSATKTITELYNQFPPLKERITALKRGIHEDLWIATSGSGLIQFKNDKIIRIIKEEDGLTSDICTSLFIDSTHIWLGTNKGLNRIETEKKQIVITRITSANGLGADFINAILLTDSNIYAGTSAGLTIFSKNIFTEESVCMFHIMQVSENNKKLKKDSVYSFPYNALNIQIDFTAISFKSAGDITYYYQLKGLNDNWNSTRANFINFPTLQHGTYMLAIKAINKFGVESDTKTILIIIHPPWWQTLLFRIAAIAALILLVAGIYWYNIRNIRRKEDMKRQFEAQFTALEQRALQAQMNPHFIFNALNSIQTFILNLDVEGANTYLTRFASLIRQTLDNSSHLLITVANELKYLETYLNLEKLRFRDKFRYEIHIDDAIDQNNTMLPGMLLQPYVENSLRHGIQHRKDNNGLISLIISKTPDNSIQYVITDNGVGRKKAAELKSSQHIEYQSRGTSINEKRIAAINNQFKTNIRVNTEDIIDENGNVTGTIVTVLISPIHKY